MMNPKKIPKNTMILRAVKMVCRARSSSSSALYSATYLAIAGGSPAADRTWKMP